MVHCLLCGKHLVNNMIFLRDRNGCRISYCKNCAPQVEKNTIFREEHVISQLKNLHNLLGKKAITKNEYEIEKKRILRE